MRRHGLVAAELTVGPFGLASHFVESAKEQSLLGTNAAPSKTSPTRNSEVASEGPCAGIR
jgi:hypothetical protein